MISLNKIKGLISRCDLGLFLFYVIFYIGERLYRIADLYSENLVYHLIGLQIGLVSLLFYLVYFLKDYKKPAKAIVICYPILLSLGLFIYTQSGIRESILIVNLTIHIFILMAITRIIRVVTFNNLSEYVIWTIFWGYRMAALGCYFMAQRHSYLEYKYDYLMANWGVTLAKSAATRYSELSSVLESMCVPSVVFISILLIVGFINKYIPKSIRVQKAKTVLILIKRPTGWISLFKLIFWRGDIRIFADGMLYKRNQGFIEKVKFNYSDLQIEKYFVIDTLVNPSSSIDKKILQSNVDKSGIAMVTSISGYEWLFLTSGFKKSILLIIIRWLSFSVSELNNHPKGMPLRDILIVIFNYPIKSLRKLLGEHGKK